MRIGILVFVSLVAGPAASFAEVNCEQVLAELKAGRTAQEVMDAHGIREGDVKACLAEAERDAWQARMRGGDASPEEAAVVPESSKGR
jgi:hypothetical protein